MTVRAHSDAQFVSHGWRIELMDDSRAPLALRPEEFVEHVASTINGAEGWLYHRSRHAITYLARIADAAGRIIELYIKTYDSSRGVGALKQRLRGARAGNALRMTQALNQAGFDTPQIVMQGKHAESGRTMIASLATQGCPLPQIIESSNDTASPARKRAILRALGAEVARLHRAGFVHGDLTPYNVFVVDAQPPRFIFLDHDRTRLGFAIGRRRRQFRNLVQLGRFELTGISRADRLRVFHAYAAGLKRGPYRAALRRLAGMLEKRRREIAAALIVRPGAIADRNLGIMKRSQPAAPLRIIGIDPERGFAGGESQVLGLTLELIKLGHCAQLLCDPRGQLWERARAAAVVCHPLPIRNALDWIAGLRLRRFLSANQFDVVHFHTSRAHSIAPFAAGMDAKLVVTRRMDYVPNRWFAPWLYNRAVNCVAAISSEVACALSTAGVSLDRITIIQSGVDCGWFAPPSAQQRTAARGALGLAENEIAIGAVGGLEPRKGHRYLLDAVAELKREGMALRCFIAGQGSQREALERQARHLGLGNAVRLLGGIADPRALFFALDVYVQPSVKEGLGVALLEAMACGLPAVASRAGGIAEVIEHRRSGLLVAPADVQQLAQALRELVVGAEKRSAIGGRARSRALEFSMETMARKTLALYLSSLGRA